MSDPNLRSALWRILTMRFSDDELRTLCFNMGLDYDSLTGEGKGGKARELITYCERRKQIPHLIDVGKELRPDIKDWPNIPLEETNRGKATLDPQTLRLIWQQALHAYYSKNWEQAEPLLAQVAAAAPNYADVQNKLTDARRQLHLLTFYRAIGKLRDDDQWQAVIAALDDLENQQPGYPDTKGLREWATTRQRFDQEIRALRSRNFPRALNLLEALLQKQPDDHAAAVLAASLIENPHVPFEQRIHAASLVADNDPRPGLNLEHQDYWAQRIEPGPFLMGDDNGTYDREKPAFTCHIRQPYALARYPVTNQQYAQFLDALKQSGRVEEAQRRQPFHWKNGRFPTGTGNHPVVRVTWEDACAFAAWVNDLLHQQGILGAGEEVRLPTEPEWERAAAYPVVLPGGKLGTGRRAYPWGDWSTRTILANTDESGIGDTSAVGVFPQGTADCGAFDLAGNVWEWCSTPYQKYPLSGDLQAESVYTVEDYKSRTYVLRGGSWSDGQSYARCACRGAGIAGAGYDYYGFRLAHLFSFS